jgi:hypothetical protein
MLEVGAFICNFCNQWEKRNEHTMHPDAPFYELDLIGLSFANAYGLDMPCQTMITVGATSLALIWGCLAALAFWGITKTIRNMRRN